MDAQGYRKAVQEALPAVQVFIREKWLWEAAAPWACGFCAAVVFGAPHHHWLGSAAPLSPLFFLGLQLTCRCKVLDRGSSMKKVDQHLLWVPMLCGRR